MEQSLNAIVTGARTGPSAVGCERLRRHHQVRYEQPEVVAIAERVEGVFVGGMR